MRKQNRRLVRTHASPTPSPSLTLSVTYSRTLFLEPLSPPRAVRGQGSDGHRARLLGGGGVVASWDEFSQGCREKLLSILDFNSPALQASASPAVGELSRGTLGKGASHVVQISSLERVQP